ncbi:gluconeogenesis factor YvcK family protein [Tomitella gaofuii]|uniref:gluconeogenesis factor YvcK family protein n=1 Tax=Tomitella gaofuii TaxID=2760083 RepID=UPI0015FA9E50|nr:uridine diphosphate-N-acetylglucosamine-binding protein YvcK [Tomitella gaofuii]
MTRHPRGPSVVALGGGHGLFATLSAVRRFSDDVTAVVTVADDGGSSGRIRSELDIIPPGDLRMALAALAAPDERGGLWTDLLQHRFRGNGALAGHSVGNLVLAGLTELLDDPVAALAELAGVLGVQGAVLPMARVPLEIAAEVTGLEDDPRVVRTLRGQVAVATTPGRVRRVRLLPADPPAVPAAVRAIGAADIVVLGPGSWFTSVIPHLLVPELYSALQESAARKVVVLNLAAEPGETAGFSTERHLQVLAQHAPDFRVDAVLADAAAVRAQGERDNVGRAADRFGAAVHYRELALPGTFTHEPGRLADALAALTGIDPPLPATTRTDHRSTAEHTTTSEHTLHTAGPQRPAAGTEGD